MKTWVHVPEDFATRVPPSSESIGGVQVTVFVSPFDSPTAVRGSFNQQLERFVVEFKYHGNEKTELEAHDRIALRLGKKSRRLYAIELDTQALGVSEITVQVVKAVTSKLEEMRNNAPDVHQRLNLRAVSKALELAQLGPRDDVDSGS
jgi:hypothetical protein